MKKIKLWSILPIICLLLLSPTIFYHTYHMVDWSDYDDTLDYIQKHYSSEVLSAEYLVSGKDEQGEYVIYEVTTKDDETHFLRLDVTFHRYLTKIGSDFKINGINKISHYEIETKQ